MANSIGTLDPLLTERDGARIIGLSLSTIRRLRAQKRGPRFIRVSAATIRYEPSAVAAFLGSRPSGGQQLGTARATPAPAAQVGA